MLYEAAPIVSDVGKLMMGQEESRVNLFPVPEVVGGCDPSDLSKFPTHSMLDEVLVSTSEFLTTTASATVTGLEPSTKMSTLLVIPLTGSLREHLAVY
jgi:hypothetical protein